MCSEGARSHSGTLRGNAMCYSHSTQSSNTSAVGRNRKHSGDTTVVIVWELVWTVFGSLPVTQLLIVADRLQDTGVYQNTLQRGNRVQLGTEVESPSMDTAPMTLPCSEHPGDSPASWRQTKPGVGVIVHEKEGKLWEIGTVEVIVEGEIRSGAGPRR